MPLQNRVRPDGAIVATSARGLFFGNRGGRFHDIETQTLHPTRRWASKQWICCALKFKDYAHPIMGKRYTGLFFMDEVTAFAAGHRPCYECRRADALRFAEIWQKSHQLEQRPKAPQMDRVLHEQRLDGRIKRLHSMTWDALPDGAVAAGETSAFAKKDDHALGWTETGYETVKAPDQNAIVQCFTPPAILKILKSGYAPRWHPSAV